MDMLNVAAIYKAIGPAGCALVLAACAAVYFALKNYIYLYIVWRDFRRAYPDIEKGGFGEECMECTGDNPLACIVRDVVHTHAGHSEDIRANNPRIAVFNGDIISKTENLSAVRKSSVDNVAVYGKHF